MALTRDVRETIATRIQIDPAFAHVLLGEAVDLIVDGEPGAAGLILRDLVESTVGAGVLAEEMGPSTFN